MCNIDEWMKKNKLQNQATPLSPTHKKDSGVH